MNIEEIRKNEPTHIDIFGDYWIIKSDSEAYFQDSNNGKWIRYAFPVNEDIVNGQIKPL